MARKKREGISKKTRFEIFKRDKFTCQYCGKKAPDVILHLDHIKPVADGGKSDILNLVTACIDCNSGKGARSLADNAVLDAQRVQLEVLQERREQLEMLIEWRDELADHGTTKLVALERAVCDELEYPGLSDFAKGQLKTWLKKFELSELFEAVKGSSASYLKYDDKGQPTDESRRKVFDYIPRVASVKRGQITKPWLSDMLYIKAIMRNNFSYVGDRRANELLEAAFKAGGTKDELRHLTKGVRNWTQWCQDMEEWLIIAGRED